LGAVRIQPLGIVRVFEEPLLDFEEMANPPFSLFDVNN
jgi:hypothetical protein